MRSVDSPSVPSCLQRSPRWATSPATCAGPGTRRPRTSSSPSTRPCGSRPARTRSSCSARSAGPGSRSSPRTRAFLEQLGAARADLERYLTGDRWYQRRVAAGEDCPEAIGYFSPEFGITAVLPQYSGGLGILAGDHLKAASDLGVPIIGVGLLYRHGYFKQALSREGWQQETYPVLDPDGLPISLLREENGERAIDQHRAARRPRPGGPDLGRQRRPGAAADARHRRRGQPRPLPRRDRPAVRRQQRAPAAPGAAARRRRRPRDPRVLPDHRAPGARGVPHQRGPRRLPRPRADPRAHGRRGRPEARLRHRARGRPRVHGVHHPHPGPGRHRPLPADPDRAVLRRRRPDPGRPGRADPRARRRGLRGRRRRRSSTWR